MEVWILANTRAGKHRARQEGESVRRVFALGGARVRMAYTGSLEEAEGFLQRAAAQKPDLLVCCGGDGTLSHAVGFLGELGAPMPLGFVPMGTTNDFANSLGMPKEPARAAEQILHGESHRLDLGSFEGRRFLYVASFGAFTQSSYKAPPQVKATLGHLAYVLESARELPFLQAIPLEVEVDGDLVQGEFLFGGGEQRHLLGRGDEAFSGTGPAGRRLFRADLDPQAPNPCGAGADCPAAAPRPPGRFPGDTPARDPVRVPRPGGLGLVPGRGVCPRGAPRWVWRSCPRRWSWCTEAKGSCALSPAKKRACRNTQQTRFPRRL